MCKTLIFLSLLLGANAFSFVKPLARRPLLTVPNMGAMDISFEELDGSDCRIGIIKTRWNKEIIDSLATGITDTLKECKVKEDYVFETEVPGAFELPLAARFLALSGTVDAIVCVGCLIKGDTMHFEYISDAVAKGLMNVGIQTSVPIVFGVLTVNTEEQAKVRATGEDNHGISWAKTAVEMALLRQSALGAKKSGSGSLATLGFGGSEVGEKSSGGKIGEKKPMGF